MIYDIIIIGGGIVGMATAYQLSEKNPAMKIAVLEKEDALAKHQTGHNSGVIHSGIYYKPGSLKAKNCIEGYNYLIEFAQKHEIPFDLCGKIIVATSVDELPALENVFQRGLENGLKGIRKISRQEITEIEPYCSGIEGIIVPQTGIIDYTSVTLAYAKLFLAKEGHIFFKEKVADILLKNGINEVVTENKTYLGKIVVNCGGLYSDKIAAITDDKLDVRIIPFRGEYFKLQEEKKHLVRNLIYPVPDPNFPFLGVHFTRMIDGAVEAGPNAVFAFKREGYKRSDFNAGEFYESVTWPGFQKVAMKYWRTGLGEYYRSFSKAAFTKALQKLIPDIQENDLIPAGSGVRAQACDRSGGLIDDFLILENNQVINVCNAPSPAATSSLAIGNTIAKIVSEKML